MPRRLKQFVYLLLFLIFWSAVAGAFYWAYLKPVPSCVDHKQNQGEEGVDCGGPCTQFCIPATLAPVQVVGEPRVFQPTPQRVSVAVKLQNPNADFAARSFSYTVTVYGETGKSFTMAGSSYIYAGDIEYLAFLDDKDEGIGRPVNAVFTVSSPMWVPKRLFVKPALRVRNATTTIAEDGSLRVEGVVASDDARDVRDITLVALFKGERGETLGTSKTELDGVTAGGTESFLIVHPPSAGVVPGSTELFVSAIRP